MTRPTTFLFAAYLALGVFLVDAVFLWLTGSSPPRGPHLQPTLARTSCGFSIKGRW